PARCRETTGAGESWGARGHPGPIQTAASLPHPLHTGNADACGRHRRSSPGKRREWPVLRIRTRRMTEVEPSDAVVIAHFTVASDHNAAGWRTTAQKQKRRIVAD